MVDVDVTSHAALRRRITDELSGFFDEQRTSLESETQPLLDELEAVFTAGGKRLRPLFCYWGYRAAGGPDGPDIIRAGAALEMLHTFAMIHDDVMDRSPVRRGRYSSFRALAELARLGPHRGDPERFGVSAAILAGDLALVLADRLMATSGFAPDALARAAVRYDKMRMRAIAGQYLDLLAAHRGEIDEEGARRIGELKSAGYTVADPLMIGAALATVDGEVDRVLEAYGRPLGQAFQIRDDVLGLYGDPETTGKDRDGDLREGKQTVLIAKTRTLAPAEDREFLEDMIGDPHLHPQDAERIREIVKTSGALDATLDLIASLTKEAQAALNESIVGAETADALRTLADEVSAREG